MKLKKNIVMDKYEIIGKDVWGVKAKNLTNVTNCSVCRYNGYKCSAIDCGEFFYLKDEEIEKLENKKNYKVIEKNEYGTLVIDDEISEVCRKCKYLSNCEDEWMKCIINTYYLPDSEAEKLELENDLKEKNEAFETRINELEEKTNICYHPYRALERNENGLFCNKCKQQVSSNQNIY